MFMRLSAALLIGILGMASARAQDKYFPPGELGKNESLDKFVSDWYSKQLKALGEPSLWEMSKTEKTEAYRFLWLRTFHHPVAIRVVINADGTSMTTVKMTSGAGGYDPGKLIKNDSLPLDKAQTESFLKAIAEQNFWRLPSRDESVMGVDGAQWVVEGTKSGNYHFVDRWSPENGGVRIMGLLFIRLAKQRFPHKEVY
jgi:hypothetical protein